MESDYRTMNDRATNNAQYYSPAQYYMTTTYEVARPKNSASIELSDRDKVSLLEEEMFKREQIPIPIKHYFSPGVYAREITIPAGTLLTGRIHLYEQLNILSSGKISVLTHEGMKDVEAPFTVVSPPGTKRIAYAHTECTWTTILATEEKDPDLIEAKFTVSTEQEFLEFVQAQQLIGSS